MGKKVGLRRGGLKRIGTGIGFLEQPARKQCLAGETAGDALMMRWVMAGALQPLAYAAGLWKETTARLLPVQGERLNALLLFLPPTPPPHIVLLLLFLRRPVETWANPFLFRVLPLKSIQVNSSLVGEFKLERGGRFSQDWIFQQVRFFISTLQFCVNLKTRWCRSEKQRKVQGNLHPAAAHLCFSSHSLFSNVRWLEKIFEAQRLTATFSKLFCRELRSPPRRWASHFTSKLE